MVFRSKKNFKIDGISSICKKEKVRKIPDLFDNARADSLIRTGDTRIFRPN